MQDDSQRLLINLHILNDIRRINAYLISCHLNLNLIAFYTSVVFYQSQGILQMVFQNYQYELLIRKLRIHHHYLANENQL